MIDLFTIGEAFVFIGLFLPIPLVMLIELRNCRQKTIEKEGSLK